MSYVNDNLLPNEKVHFRAKINAVIFLPAIVAFLGVLFFFVLAMTSADTGDSSSLPEGFLHFLLAIVFLLYTIRVAIRAMVIMLTTEFAVTNRRVIAKRGFIRRHTLEMFLKQIESVSVKQNVLGRLLKFGTVTVIGTGGTRERFKAITDPVKTRKIIQQIIEHYVHNQTASS